MSAIGKDLAFMALATAVALIVGTAAIFAAGAFTSWAMDWVLR